MQCLQNCAPLFDITCATYPVCKTSSGRSSWPGRHSGRRRGRRFARSPASQRKAHSVIVTSSYIDSKTRGRNNRPTFFSDSQPCPRAIECRILRNLCARSKHLAKPKGSMPNFDGLLLAPHAARHGEELQRSSIYVHVVPLLLQHS